MSSASPFLQRESINEAISRMIGAAERYEELVNNSNNNSDGSNNNNVGDTNTNAISMLNCVVHVHLPPAKQEDEYLKLLDQRGAKIVQANNAIDTLDFNIFEFELSVESPDLVLVAFEIFKRNNFQQLLSTNNDNVSGPSDRALMRFLCTVRRNMFDCVPYHNFRHACNVLQTLHVYLNKLAVGFTIEEKFAALVAAICHDLQHPGVANTFLAATNAPLALRYNDRAILEQHHCSCTFAIADAAALPDNGGETIFSWSSNRRASDATPAVALSRFHELRKMITTMILATEVPQHHCYVEKVVEIAKKRNQQQQQQQQEGAWLPSADTDKEARLVLLCALVEAADISNEVRTFEVSKRWCPLVTLEFARQGDRMRALGMQVPLLYDRERMDIPREQQGFVNFMCLPLYRALASVFPAMEVCVEQLQRNVSDWQGLENPVQISLEMTNAAALSVPDRRRSREE